jgi:hypothetical protein
MALSTDQVIDTLTKITGFPSGLFKETETKTRFTITSKVFFCDADIDEYNVLINGKDEIVEIKNSDNTWGQALIVDLLSPKHQPQQTTTSAPVTTQATNSLPVLTSPFNIYTILDPAMLSKAAQYIGDYVQLNVGCIQQLFGTTATVNEASAHLGSAWEFTMIDGDHTSVTLTFEAIHASDPNIVSGVSGQICIDYSGNVLFTNIEG